MWQTYRTMFWRILWHRSRVRNACWWLLHGQHRSLWFGAVNRFCLLINNFRIMTGPGPAQVGGAITCSLVHLSSQQVQLVHVYECPDFRLLQNP
jgi:hypothetical protein